MRRGGVCVAANLGDETVRLPLPEAQTGIETGAGGAGGARLLLASDPAIQMETGVDGDSKTPVVILPGASVAVCG
jgi:hypothetical protein